MSNPTTTPDAGNPPGEWACPECGKAYKSDGTYPPGTAPICGRHAVPMVPINRAPERVAGSPTPAPDAGQAAEAVRIYDMLQAIADHRSCLTDSPDDYPRWAVYPAGSDSPSVVMDWEQVSALEQIGDLAKKVLAYAEHTAPARTAGMEGER